MTRGCRDRESRTERDRRPRSWIAGRRACRASATGWSLVAARGAIEEWNAGKPDVSKSVAEIDALIAELTAEQAADLED
jgi:hypothetical protein